MENFWLQQRGEYWIKRLADDYSITVTGAWPFITADSATLSREGGTYGVTWKNPPVVKILDRLLEYRIAAGDKAAVPLIDEMLVHELIHASGIYNHGAGFKQRYSKVYPWSKPGPVTEFDPGTPRKALWARILEEVPPSPGTPRYRRAQQSRQTPLS